MNKMKVGVLFSGGKDSVFAAFLAKRKGHQISCLMTMESQNSDSYMFHTPSIKMTEIQSNAMEIPIIFKETKGEKEKELKDLEKLVKKAKKDYGIQGVFTGAVESVYQSSRIKKICDDLELKCFNPLWKKNPEEYWEEIFKNNFKIIITGVASFGLGKEWLGRKINKNHYNELKKLQKKFLFHLSFEGGEAETFVLDCPLFKKKIKILKGKKIWDGNSGRYNIEKIKLIDK